MPNSEWNIFMDLLRAGLWEKDLRLAESPDPAFWNTMLQHSRNQAVAGLLLRGITHLPKEQLPPSGIRMKLLAEADYIERRNIQVNLVEAEVLEHFEKGGVVAQVMKGSRAAKHYANPMMRESGDIDLYIPKEYFQKACELVPKARKSPDGSAVFTHGGVIVELHGRYYDLHLPLSKLPPVPSVTGESLLYSSHILKHALGSGIGLKQLCDMARALTMTEGTYDKKEFEAILVRSRLMRWHNMLCSLLVSDLELDPVYCLDNFKQGDAEPLRKIIRESGSFGSASESRIKAIQSGSTLAKKTNTTITFIKRLPFSMKIAPGEALATIRELISGNISR